MVEGGKFAFKRYGWPFARHASALAASLLLFGCGGGGGSDGAAIAPTPTPSASPTPTIPVATIAQAMTPGINLGNTLEAVNLSGPFPYTSSQEGYWGNPQVNQTIFNAYAAAGFKSVRIPVAWSEYAASDYTIQPFWLSRVAQVVQYARNAGLYVVINIHWDGGWIDAQSSLQASVQTKMTKFWTQIANNFKNSDDHLLFAAMNEVGDSANSGNPTSSDCAIQQSYNQTFVNAVRATGGNNASRPLVVQGYYTNINESQQCNATMPTDSAENALMMEIHYYDPYDFTLNGSSSIWQWGAGATIPTATETWANEAYVDAQFQKMQTTFVNNGVPVIMGEYGAYDKLNSSGQELFPGMKTYVLAWDKYVTSSAVKHGVVPMYWDTGGLIDRNNGSQLDPSSISTIVSAAAP